MIDLSSLTSQVKKNCNISDAKYWGNYTICTLLLWLRELYKFESGIRPWENVEKAAVLDWISDREKLWSEYEDKDFIPIDIDNTRHSPFDIEAINTKCSSRGLIYGAGYGRQMKPSFFLAELHENRTAEGYAVSIAGREYARDLAAYPAMAQDGKILIRKEVILLLLWDKFTELQSNQLKSSLAFAFNCYGVSPDEEPSEELNAKFLKIAAAEAETYIYHEVGELAQGERLGEQWKLFLFSISNSRAELLARGIKDLLADTSENGMLRHLIDFQKSGSLAFYVSALRGYGKSVFGEVFEAFDGFAKEKNWSGIEKARENCHKRLTSYAGTMLALYKKETDRTRLINLIEREFSHLF